RPDGPIANGVVADDAPAVVVSEHGYVISLRPIVAEADNGLELMRGRELPHRVLVVPIVVTHYDLTPVVAVSRGKIRPGIGEALSSSSLEIDDLHVDRAVELCFHDRVPPGLVHLNLIKARDDFVS